MTAPRRRPVLANAVVVGGVLLLLSLVYVLSYAPAMSVMIHRDPTAVDNQTSWQYIAMC